MMQGKWGAIFSPVKTVQPLAKARGRPKAVRKGDAFDLPLANKRQRAGKTMKERIEDIEALQCFKSLSYC